MLGTTMAQTDTQNAGGIFKGHLGSNTEDIPRGIEEGSPGKLPKAIPAEMPGKILKYTSLSGSRTG